jgi:hypothetical protein
VAQVDIPGLARTGYAVEHTSTAFQAAIDRHAAQLSPAGTLKGWASGEALPHTAETWAAFMKCLAAQVNTFGADLVVTAKAYDTADANAASRVTSAGIPAGHPANGMTPR